MLIIGKKPSRGIQLTSLYRANTFKTGMILHTARKDLKKINFSNEPQTVLDLSIESSVVDYYVLDTRRVLTGLTDLQSRLKSFDCQFSNKFTPNQY